MPARTYQVRDLHGKKIDVGARVSCDGDNGTVVDYDDWVDADMQEGRYVQCAWPSFVVQWDGGQVEKITSFTEHRPFSDPEYVTDEVEVICEAADG